MGSMALLSLDARAQVVVGGNRLPAVTVDNSVLDRLGPPLNLPQLFLGDRGTPRPARPVASSTVSHRVPTHRVAVRRPVVRHVAVAQPQPRSSLDQVINLTPPAPRVASAAPVGHDTAAVNAPTTPAVAAPAAPTPPAAVVPVQPAATSPPSAPAAPPPATQAASASPAPPPLAPSPTVAANPFPATAPTTTAAPGILSPAQVAAAQAAAAAAPGSTPPAPAASPPVQMAAATTVGGGLSSIKFAPGATDLPSGPQPTLDAIAARLLHDDNLRVQVIAHATGTSDEAMEARRVSLARAVAVRAYLIDKGVRSLRIDVRALGNRDDDGPARDQVDLMVVSQ